MFKPGLNDGFREPIAGIKIRSLAHGAKTHCTEFRLQKGCVLPRHSHEHEQTGYLISGALRLTIGRETFDARPGDSWSIAGGVEHEAVVLADTVAIEVFSPVRQDYL